MIQLVVGIIGLVSVKHNYDALKKNIKDELMIVFNEYGNDTESQAVIDSLQSTVSRNIIFIVINKLNKFKILAKKL